MGLVDDHEIKMADAETPLAVRCLIDKAHHRRIGRDKDTSLFVLVGHQVDWRGIRQMSLEGIHRLIDKRHAVGEKEHAFGPVATHQ